jgi:hypothetical protein
MIFNDSMNFTYDHSKYQKSVDMISKKPSMISGNNANDVSIDQNEVKFGEFQAINKKIKYKDVSLIDPYW